MPPKNSTPGSDQLTRGAQAEQSSHADQAGRAPEKLAKAPSTERAQAFRKRLAEGSMTRWEIMGSEKTRDQVRAIAKIEGLSAGLAAEALLSLGIEAYHRSPAENEVLTTGDAVLGEPLVRPHESMSRPVGASGAVASTASAGPSGAAIASSGFNMMGASFGAASPSGRMGMFDEHVESDRRAFFSSVIPPVLDTPTESHALVVRSSFRTPEEHQAVLSKSGTSPHASHAGVSGIKKLAAYSSRPSVDAATKALDNFFDRAQKRKSGGNEEKE